MAKAGYIGIDVCGTKTRLSLLDANFKVLEDIKLTTLSSSNAATFKRTLKETLSDLMDRGRTRGQEIQNVGVIHHGPNGSAGDLGNYVMDVQTSAALKNTRVLNDVAIRPAIAAAAAALAGRHKAPYLLKTAGKDPDNISAAALAEAIAHRDTHVERLVRERCYLLGVALSNFVDFLNPEVIVLGGGLADKMPVLIRTEVEAGIRRNPKLEPIRALDVVNAKLKGHAVPTGAAKLSADTALSLIAA
jgi:predicted NBD/HSP70 family sugar kinase